MVLHLISRRALRMCLVASAVDIGQREIVQSLVTSTMVVAFDEGRNSMLQIVRRIIISRTGCGSSATDLPSLNLTLRHRMAGLAADVANPVPSEKSYPDVNDERTPERSLHDIEPF